MHRTILKYWIIDLLIGLVLYAAYTITIMNKTASGNGFFANVLYFLDIVLNLGYSLLYLIAVAICSFTVFLNFFSKIRHHPILSWLSFSGAPVLVVAMPIISLWISTYDFSKNVMTELLIFSILYPCITTILYLQFRKKYKTLNGLASTDALDVGH